MKKIPWSWFIGGIILGAVIQTYRIGKGMYDAGYRSDGVTITPPPQ